MAGEINTTNDFLFGTSGTEMGPLLPLRILSREQAYRTAAWIKIMGEFLPEEDEETKDLTFEQIEEAILNT